jgi:hypothetical protein
VNNLTETEKAYIAGFFDGEGCINISKYQGKNNRTPSYYLQVIIAQNGFVTLSQIREWAGVGALNQVSPKIYHWTISSQEAANFLKIILPYLHNKAAEANVAIDFQSRQGHKQIGHTGKGWVVPKNLIDEKETYYKKLQDMKGMSGKLGRRGRPLSNKI